MNRRNVILAIALLLMVGLVVGIIVRTLSGPPANRLLVAGDVRSVTFTVTAPQIQYPSAVSVIRVPSNPAAGDKVAMLVVGRPLAPTPVSALASSTGGASPLSRTGLPIPSGKLVHVYAQVGDHVVEGQVLARLDTKMLDLGVTQAKLSKAAQKTTVRVLNNSLDTILDNIGKLATGRAQLSTARGQLATAKTKLATAKAGLLKARAALLAGQKPLLDAKKHRSQLQATLASLEAQAATFPPGNVPPALVAKIAQLTKLLASIDPGLAAISANLKKVKAGLAQVAAGEAQLAAGAVKLATAAAQLSTASSALHTAKTQVKTLRDAVKIAVKAADVPVALAEAYREQATIIAPVSGFVTQAPAQGTVAVVNAPLFRVAPDGPALIDTYVTGQQLGALHDGTIADITYDSGGGRVLHARLHTLGAQALYPPTSFPTDIVHMTRTVKITFQLDSGQAPPAGTPVDIAIHTD